MLVVSERQDFLAAIGFWSQTIFDAFVKSRKPHFPVIPEKAGIPEKQVVLDPGFRRGDDHWDFLRFHQSQVASKGLG
jgi:hypothetical protein